MFGRDILNHRAGVWAAAFVGLQHVPGWTEIYSVVMSKKRALAFLIHVSRSLHREVRHRLKGR
jgi:hypothetical protein